MKLFSSYIGVIENPFAKEVNCLYVSTALKLVEKELDRSAVDRLMETLLDRHLNIVWDKGRLEQYLNAEHSWVDAFLNRVVLEIAEEMLGIEDFYYRLGQLAIQPNRFQHTVARLFTIKGLYQLIDFANRNLNSVVVINVHDKTRRRGSIVLKRWSKSDYKRKILQCVGKERSLRQWMKDECAITRGILQGIPTLLDKAPAELIREPVCEGRGDAYCLYHLQWEADAPLDLLQRGLRRLASLDYHWVMKAKIRSMETIIQDKTGELVQTNYKLEQANEKLRQMQKTLVEQERMLTEKHIAGGMAHEIKNTLGAAKLRLEQVLDQDRLEKANLDLMNILNIINSMDSNNDNRLSIAVQSGRNLFENFGVIGKTLQEIESAVDRGLAVTNRVMAYSRLHLDKGADQINLDEVVKTLARTYEERLLQSGIVLELVVEDRPLMVKGLENHFFSIVQNVLLNARDAIVEKQPPLGHIRLSAWKTTTGIMVEIADNGIGIPADKQDQIFYPFFSTKANRGMGLGLNECQKLLSQYNGRITVESEPGQGATVTITILNTEQATNQAGAAGGHEPDNTE